MPSHGDLRIEVFNDPMYLENGLLVWPAGRRECWIVDPGLPPQPQAFAAALREHGLTPDCFLLTHCHVDHIAGLTPLRETLPDVPIVCPADEIELLTDPEQNLSAFSAWPVTAPPADRVLSHGDAIELGPLAWRVLDVAGHSPGGLAYYCPKVGVAIVGDALFAESIGRTDFPHSDHDRLIRNIRDHLLTLPPDTVIYSGHGPAARLSDVKRYNLVLRQELGR